VAAATIEIERVTKRYSGHVAVRELSLKVPPGVIYGLLGPNGAGKTTTIRMVNDIVKPDEGKITLFGQLPPGRHALARIGYLPEERGIYQKMTVRRVLTFLAELRGLDTSVVAPRIQSWLDRLELGRWIDSKVEALSKGMQQKVQFVATVLHEPDLLILDEPFSGLDPINADVLREIVREQRSKGKTILFSTHLMEHAEQICDDVCIIARSEKVLDGELSTVKRAAGAEQNAYVIEIEPASEQPPAVLAGEGVVTVAGAKGRFRVQLKAGTAPRDLLRRMLDDGLDVGRFERFEPTLHQIFVDAVTRRHGSEAAAEIVAGVSTPQGAGAATGGH
jgi:ABC-2 type transport system ATP-binding protein